MTFRFSVKTAGPRNGASPGYLPLLFACALYWPTAHGVERVGDATYLYELEQYAAAAWGIENQFLSLIDAAAGDERFDLYWTYNHLSGARVQLDLLQSQMELSISAPSHLDEGTARATLRDQAEFVVWELDGAIAELEQSVPELKRSGHLRAGDVLLSLLSALRTTVSRLAAG
jgi:hypothetical protein